MQALVVLFVPRKNGQGAQKCYHNKIGQTQQQQTQRPSVFSPVSGVGISSRLV